MSGEAVDANAAQRRYWNTVAGPRWVATPGFRERRNQESLALLLARLGLAGGESVLEIGCGTGALTLPLAAAVGEHGRVVAVDISEPMLGAARQKVGARGLRNVTLLLGDAQVFAFEPAAFDLAISRFGVMFFSDPAAAFANIARGLHPGGRIAFVCWQPMANNEWITVLGAAAAQHIPLPPPDDPGSPGPFSLGDRQHLAAVLDAAGFVNVAIQPVVESLWLGRDVADTVEFFQASGFGQRLLQDADPATRTRVMAAVQAALEPHLTSDGVRLGSRAWLVTARNPQ
jgi:SAM-dependent methyltransferase